MWWLAAHFPIPDYSLSVYTSDCQGGWWASVEVFTVYFSLSTSQIFEIVSEYFEFNHWLLQSSAFQYLI